MKICDAQAHCLLSLVCIINHNVRSVKTTFIYNFMFHKEIAASHIMV